MALKATQSVFILGFSRKNTMMGVIFENINNE